MKHNYQIEIVFWLTKVLLTHQTIFIKMTFIKSSKILVTISLLICVLGSLSDIELANCAASPKEIPSQIEEIRVLGLVATNFGWNFFDVKDQLEAWNVTVTVIAPTQTTFSCDNRGSPIPITADILLSDFEDADFANYDCLFVPSGAWWFSAANNPTITEFIKSAYEHGLIVSSMCVGSGILGAADIVEGKKLLCHGNSAYLISNAGGIRTSGINVTSDEKLVTGDTGGGLTGGGDAAAPYTQFSEFLIKESLGLTYLDQYSIEKVTNVPGSSHKISVITQTIHELDQILTGNERNILEVKVVFYPKSDRKSSFQIPLNKISENFFEGYINEEIDGRYKVKIEIYTDFEDLEIDIVDNTLWINTIPGYPLWIIVSLSCAVLGMLVVTTRRKIHSL